MAAPQVSFRPFVEVTGVYDTGLAGVSVSDSGQLGNLASEGVTVAWGISGTHSWRHTLVGLDYQGSLNHFAKNTAFDTINESLLLGVSHDLSRHAKVVLRQAAGTFGRDFGVLGLPGTVPFDPTTSFIPTTDFFDNRTLYLSTQADLVVQKSARLSYSLGGSGFLTRRRSSALEGVSGATAKADVHYRISRRTTVGGLYSYEHFGYNHITSGSDLHGVAFSFGTRITRFWEITGYGGALRMESKYLQTEAVDPVIAALLGITSTSFIRHTIEWVPSYSLRASRTFSRGVAYGTVSSTVTPGNGLFLTSKVLMYSGGYTYTGLRRWSFAAAVVDSRGASISNVIGAYDSLSGTVTLSRQIGGSFHFVTSYALRKYSSPNFDQYNRVVNEARVGVGFTPGDVPLRIW